MPKPQKRTSDNEGPELQSAEKELNDKIKRLSSAKSVRDEIQKNKIMPEYDRLIFARNLGKMYEVASKRDGYKMNKYFQKAFGKLYESQYKKKNNYVLLPGKSAADRYHARSLNYLELAKVMAAPTTDRVQDPEDLELRAILRLVEGSSFDNRQTRTGRRRKEQETQLVDKMDKVVSFVEAEADLAGFRENANSCKLGVPPAWPQEGDLSIVSGSGWGRTLDVTREAIFEERPRLGPSIPICEIRTPAALASYALVQVPKARAEHLGLAAAVSYSIYEAFGLTIKENISEDEYHEGWWVLNDGLYDLHWGEPVHALRRLNEREDNFRHILTSLKPTIEARLGLHLQVRFDILYEQWKPTLTLQNWDQDDCFLTEIRGGEPFGTLAGKVGLPGNWAPFVDLKKYETPDSRLFMVAWPEWIGPMDLLWRALDSSDPNKVRAVDKQFYKSIHGLHQGTLVLPGQEAIDFLIEPLNPAIHKINFKVDVPEKGFTGFIQDSLADAIFRNLAYAEPDKKIDALLRADARERAAKLQAFVNEERAKFEEGLSRLG